MAAGAREGSAIRAALIRSAKQEALTLVESVQLPPAGLVRFALAEVARIAQAQLPSLPDLG
jgi:hypothetical protein